MSHIDDGALHAYLDGALDEYPAAEAKRVREHLETCGACARRLEEERAVRGRAASILALATPRVETPSFEELKAYVQATRPAGMKRSVRLYRFGWAASVVLALGVGWLARGGELERALAPGGVTEPELQAPRALDDAAEAAAPAPAEVPEEAEAAGAGDVFAFDAARDAAASKMMVEAAGPAAPTREPAVGLTTEPEPERARPAAAPPAMTDVIREAAPADAIGNAAGAVVADISPPAISTPEEGLRPEVTVAAPAPVAPVDAGAERARAAELDARREDEARARAALTAQITVSAVPPAPAAGRATDEQAAAALDADDALAVPGVELSYANLAEGTSPAGIHVVQQLENGEILDVYHLPEGVDPSVLPPVESLRNEVRAQRDGGWVVLRARLSTEELKALLARIVPEG